MKKITKFNLRTLLVLVLSLALCFSTLLSVACDNTGNSSSSSLASIEKEETVYPTDTQAITNGDFEFSTFENKATEFPDSTSIGWSRTLDSMVVSADSSVHSSGIINTKASDPDSLEAYNTMAEKQGFSYTEDENGVKTYYNPGTPYDYNFIAEDSTFVWNYDSEAEDAEVPTNDDGLPMTGSKVLMIHNKTNSTLVKGTAQKFTSTSSLSLAKNEYAELSIWVKTHELVSSFEGATPGAYIAVQNTISTAAAPVMLTNINTNGAWAKYTLYLASSDFSTSSFKLVLGLGTGSKADTTGYVEGYAFFDNVTYKTISREAYIEGTSNDCAEVSLYKNYELVEDTISLTQAGQTFTANTKEGENANTSFTTVKYSLLIHSQALITMLLKKTDTTFKMVTLK